jgi:hypothetical protein
MQVQEIFFSTPQITSQLCFLYGCVPHYIIVQALFVDSIWVLKSMAIGDIHYHLSKYIIVNLLIQFVDSVHYLTIHNRENDQHQTVLSHNYC